MAAGREELRTSSKLDDRGGRREEGGSLLSRARSLVERVVEEEPLESPSTRTSLTDGEEVVVAGDLRISLPRSLSIPSPLARPIPFSTSRRRVLLADPTTTGDDACEEVVEVGSERRVLGEKGRIERLDYG